MFHALSALTLALTLTLTRTRRGQRNDWATFAPGVQPGDLVATKLNPLLPHAVPEGKGVFYS